MTDQSLTPWDAMTARFLAQSGLREGMRVLDLGCGYGSVSRLLARLVGPSGTVVGIERDRETLEVARSRSDEQEFRNLSFVHGDFRDSASALGLFDAAVGRRVLKYQPDPVHAVKCVAQSVRPGGLVLFEELDGAAPPSALVPFPLHERVRRWIWRTLELTGTNMHMGPSLYTVLVEAGLATPEVRAEAVVHRPDAPTPHAAIVRFMLPRIVEQGVASVDEIDIDTLDARLQAELGAAKTVYISDVVFAAWARTSDDRAAAAD